MRPNLSSQRPSLVDWQYCYRRLSSHQVYHPIAPRGLVSRARLPPVIEENIFTLQERVRMLHLTEIILAALRVFRDLVSVREWLRSPNPVMGGKTPLSMISSGQDRRGSGENPR